MLVQEVGFNNQIKRREIKSKVNFTAGSAAMLPKYANDLVPVRPLDTERFKEVFRNIFKRASLKKAISKSEMFAAGRKTIGSEVNRYKNLTSANFSEKSKLLPNAKLVLKEKLFARDYSVIEGRVTAQNAMITDESELKGALFLQDEFSAAGGAKISGYVESKSAVLNDVSVADKTSRFKTKKLHIDNDIFDGRAITDKLDLIAPTIGENAVIMCKDVSNATLPPKIFGVIHAENCPEELLTRFNDNIVIHQPGWFEKQVASGKWNPIK